MRDDRRLNALARGRLRAQRAASPRLAEDDATRSVPRREPREAAPAEPSAAVLRVALAR